MHLPASPACDITTIAWNKEGSLLATGAYDGIVRVWTYRGELFTVMTQHQGPIFSIKWSQTGWLLTGSLDETAIVWDVESGGKAKQRFAHHVGKSYSQFCGTLFSSLFFSDGCLDVEWLDGDFFASCGSDRVIYVECVGQFTAMGKLQGHQDEINQLKYQPDSKLLASGADDYMACIWNMEEFKKSMTVIEPNNPQARPEMRTPKHYLRGHQGEVANISWQPRNGQENYEPVLVT